MGSDNPSGHSLKSSSTPEVSSKENAERTSILKNMIKSFLMPTLVGKTLVMYFGLNYSMYPGEGYGYGLAFAIALTLYGLLRFAWKYKDQEEL